MKIDIRLKAALITLGWNLVVNAQTAPGKGWYGPWGIKMVTSQISTSSAGYSQFGFYHAESPGYCGLGGAHKQTVFYEPWAPGQPSNLASAQATMATLLTAMTAGQKAWLHFDGTGCNVNGITLCADPADCPQPPYEPRKP